MADGCVLLHFSARQQPAHRPWLDEKQNLDQNRRADWIILHEFSPVRQLIRVTFSVSASCFHKNLPVWTSGWHFSGCWPAVCSKSWLQTKLRSKPMNKSKGSFLLVIFLNRSVDLRHVLCRFLVLFTELTKNRQTEPKTAEPAAEPAACSCRGSHGHLCTDEVFKTSTHLFTINLKYYKAPDVASIRKWPKHRGRQNAQNKTCMFVILAEQRNEKLKRI